MQRPTNHRARNDQRNRGFTILELLIVTTIIAIIVTMAIPSLLASKKAAMETRAIGHLKMIRTVNAQYSLRFGTYAPSVNDLVSSGTLQDNREAGAAGSDGYTFGYSATQRTFEMQAWPDEPGITGDRYFFIDNTGVIHWSSTGLATSASPALD